MPNLHIHRGEIVHANQLLKDYSDKGGISIIQATFAYSYFVHPDKVRKKTPYFPNKAHTNPKHYPRLGTGDCGKWHGDGRMVRLSKNQPARSAWARYTGRILARLTGLGYEARHIWGNSWNPDAFTAGWNLCFMPSWTPKPALEFEDPELAKAFRQASWDLYFKDNPVCQPPDFVSNPGCDLELILKGQPILILDKG